MVLPQVAETVQQVEQPGETGKGVRCRISGGRPGLRSRGTSTPERDVRGKTATVGMVMADPASRDAVPKQAPIQESVNARESMRLRRGCRC